MFKIENANLILHPLVYVNSTLSIHLKKYSMLTYCKLINILLFTKYLCFNLILSLTDGYKS
jgi:hypothetical protein